MELGAIGELVGGVAVVASLLFVGLQLRQNNKLATTSVVQVGRDVITDLIKTLCSNGETTKLYVPGLRDREELSSDDRIRFDMLLLQQFRAVESSSSSTGMATCPTISGKATRGPFDSLSGNPVEMPLGSFRNRF
jgi:hypothetical protein